MSDCYQPNQHVEVRTVDIVGDWWQPGTITRKLTRDVYDVELHEQFQHKDGSCRVVAFHTSMIRPVHGHQEKEEGGDSS